MKKFLMIIAMAGLGTSACWAHDLNKVYDLSGGDSVAYLRQNVKFPKKVGWKDVYAFANNTDATVFVRMKNNISLKPNQFTIIKRSDALVVGGTKPAVNDGKSTPTTWWGSESSPIQILTNFEGKQGHKKTRMDSYKEK